ncbi:hypothetical protein GWK41_08515 [Persephonella atlantica]|uniref:Uncharacterized protein n=1 Tax=Persephonella atlantica TaxID=2699429 RepID=A0ABS1GJV5_9AQUI|nr:hypothetical protein [Persephonella atlantica]MBK3333111.1 hypothetical protein [Persephonella atlantica]
MEEKLIKELLSIQNALGKISTSIERIIELLEQEKIRQEYTKTKEVIISPTETEYEDKNELIQFLEKNRLKVVNFESMYNKEIILNLAKFIGDKYEFVNSFIKEAKKSINVGKPINMFLKNKRQEEISYICQLGNMLYEIAYLSEYKYFNSPKYTLKAIPTREGEVINFFNGKWLEYYIIIKVKETINNLDLDTSYISGIQIQFPNGNYGELDVLFKIGNEIFWFEAKTGEYQNYIHKYKNLRKMLGIKPENAFMIITDITNAGAEAVSSLFDMTVANLETFEDKLLKSLKKVLQ